MEHCVGRVVVGFAGGLVALAFLPGLGITLSERWMILISVSLQCSLFGVSEQLLIGLVKFISIFALNQIYGSFSSLHFISRSG